MTMYAGMHGNFREKSCCLTSNGGEFVGGREEARAAYASSRKFN
jgi:hypothetical protein